MPKLVDHADRRSRLAEAAADVIAGQGLDATGLRAVADASALTTGAVTHYFASKAALIDAAYDAVMDRLLERQAEGFFGDPPAPAAIVDQMAAVLPVDSAGVRDWRVWLAFSARAIVDPRMQQRHRAYYARITAALAAELASAGAPAVMADLVVAILDGLGIRMLLEPDDWPPSRVAATLAAAMPMLFPASAEVSP